jgi:GNAT superfamily N-acetyltransferase
MPTLGAQVVPARLLELRRLLQDLEAEDLSALDASFGGWMSRPLGREALASVVLPAAGSLYLCLLNFEPAGLILLERGKIAARVRALAVAPDLRRRGLARTMLEEAEALALDRGLSWLWMSLPPANDIATRCALACGFRRYRPQFLRRERGAALPIAARQVRAELLDAGEAKAQLAHWLVVEAEAGDAWCAEMAQNDLMPCVLPRSDEGKVFLLVSGAEEVGVAHLAGDRAHTTMTLHLDQHLWNTPREFALFKAVLDTLSDVPARIDLVLGSSGHLRASVVKYKALGFRPVLFERAMMVKLIAEQT